MDQSSLPSEKQPDYYAYLLRLWREEGTGENWRASLENARTGERIGFASLADVFGYLDRQLKPALRAAQKE
jgi:hypothetical protein